MKRERVHRQVCPFFFTDTLAVEKGRLRIPWNSPSFRHPGIEPFLPRVHQTRGKARKRPNPRPSTFSLDALPIPTMLGDSFEAPLRDFLHFTVTRSPSSPQLTRTQSPSPVHWSSCLECRDTYEVPKMWRPLAGLWMRSGKRYAMKQR